MLYRPGEWEYVLWRANLGRAVDLRRRGANRLNKGPALLDCGLRIADCGFGVGPFGSFVNPFANQFDLIGLERGAAERHSRLVAFAQNAFHQARSLAVSGNDDRA